MVKQLKIPSISYIKVAGTVKEDNMLTYKQITYITRHTLYKEITLWHRNNINLL